MEDKSHPPIDCLCDNCNELIPIEDIDEINMELDYILCKDCIEKYVETKTNQTP